MSSRACLTSFLGVALLAGALRAEPRTPVLQTRYFAVHSDFELNLQDALVNAGLARTKERPELFRSGEEQTCFQALAPALRAGWNRAVDYYAEIVSPGGFAGQQQFVIRLQLAGFGDEVQGEQARDLVAIAQGFRAAAAPAYRACRWAAQDARNRQWIGVLKQALERDEAAVAKRVEQLYATSWRTLPILVDVVQTVDWSGANTSWSDAGQGHLLLAVENPESAALELVFHEASHVLMGRDAPVRAALDRAARVAGVEIPRDLWHLVLFYTTGEAVRPFAERLQGSSYRTMLEDIQARGDGWAEHRTAIEDAWRPYVEGKRPLEDAAARLVALIGVRKENG